MQGFLKCFISELCWCWSLPACSLHSVSRVLAAFVWICICSSHFHLPPLCPRNHLCESTMTFPNLYVFAFPVTAFSSFTQSHQVMETWTRKFAQIIAISETQGHLHFSIRQQHLKYTEWNLGNLAHPQLIEYFPCLLLHCKVNWHFVDSTSLQSPFLYNFNSPSARISCYYSRWLYALAQLVFEKQCHASFLFFFPFHVLLNPYLTYTHTIGIPQK